ncbi:MAG TPA: IS66 family transposase [Chloroflexi bacterium]|nr:IS66 family transposase [Chloroflexota bacterium]
MDIDLASENERLRAENAALRQRVAELEERVAQLEAELERLKSQLEEAERAGKRQAAPFSKGPPKANPRRPGRKAGHAPAHRPRPERVDRTLEAELPPACPDWGGKLTHHRVEEQFVIDIPPVEPIVTQFNVHIADCADCGKRVQGRHPEQISDALGAAAVQFGARVLGLAAELKHGMGVPYRKVERIFSVGYGLKVSPGGLARGGQRLARQGAPTYERLIQVLRESTVVNADETSWKIGGDKAWLWVFTNLEVSVYTIDPTRAHEVVERVLGEEFDGVLGCDCFPAYDPLAYRQQKCLGHLLKRCSKSALMESEEAVAFSQKVAHLLRRAIQLKERKSEMSPHGYRVARGKLEAALNRLLAQEATDPEAAKLLKLLTKQRPHLLTFLYVDEVDATNNIAERTIRPAVIVRKISAGNRSDKGADTHAILASIIQTCRQQERDFLDVATELLGNPTPQALTLVVANRQDESMQPGHSPAQPLGP